MQDRERRQYARLPMERRVKLVCRTTGRCYAGATRNVSLTGCLVELDEIASSAPLAAGGPVRIGIDWTGRQGLLQSSHMPEGHVIRILGLNGRRQVAVNYTHRQELAASA